MGLGVTPCPQASGLRMTESRTRPEGLAGSRVEGEGTGAGRGGRQLTARVASGPGDGHLPRLHSPVADQASCLLLSPLCLCPAAALSLTLALGRETEAPLQPHLAWTLAGPLSRVCGTLSAARRRTPGGGVAPGAPAQPSTDTDTPGPCPEPKRTLQPTCQP